MKGIRRRRVLKWHFDKIASDWMVVLRNYFFFGIQPVLLKGSIISNERIDEIINGHTHHQQATAADSNIGNIHGPIICSFLKGERRWPFIAPLN